MHLSLEQFASLVGNHFVVHTQAGPIQLLLREVTELPRGNRPAQFRTPLSLVFTGPADIALTQDNYMLEHPAFGQQQWCIVPILSDYADPTLAVNAQLRHYQILFS